MAEGQTEATGEEAYRQSAFYKVLGRLVPDRLQLPLRFWRARLTGHLEPELRLLPQLVGAGRRAVDVGANQGFYTYALARLCREVEAFEPQPWCARKIEVWGRGNVRVHRVGLSEAPGRATLHVPIREDGRLDHPYASLRNLGGKQHSFEVEIRTLDSFGFRELSFLKVDVEGHELEVLRGARETLKRERPTLLVEVEQRHLGDTPIQAVFDEVLGQGYRGRFRLGGGWHELPAFSVQEHQEAHLAGKPGAPYVFNFVFQPA